MASRFLLCGGALFSLAGLSESLEIVPRYGNSTPHIFVNA